MPTVTLRPDGTYDTAGWTVTGAATMHAALSDVSDDSWVTTAAGEPLVRVEELPALPAGSRVAAVRLGLRSQRVSFLAGVDLRLRYDHNRPDGPGSPFDMIVKESLSSFGSITWRFSPWHSHRLPGGAKFLGSGWNETVLRIAALLLKRAADTDSRIYELAVDVDYGTAPVATITSPGAVVDDTTRPTILVAYSGGDDAAHDGTEVRIYEGSHPSLPAGDPVADSGTLHGPVGEWQTPHLDNDTTYTAFARVRRAWSGSGGDFWSEWDPHTFDIDLVTPDPPDLTVTGDNDTATVAVEITPAPAGIAPEWHVIQYRDHPDDLWQPLRFADQLSGTAPPVIIDHEVRFRVARDWRARAVAIIDGQEIASPPSPTRTVTLDTPGAWITDVHDPDIIHTRINRAPGRSTSWEGREVVHRPAGMDIAVVEAAAAGRTDIVTLWTLDPAEHDLVAGSLVAGRTLLWRDERDHLYIRVVGARVRVPQGVATSGVHRFDITTVQVERPPS